jgi:PAS domain S-box-containing protein
MSNDNMKTILLVEDEAITSIVISKTLVKFGYNVITADTGEKAVETALSNNNIDLILMDIDLGKGIDGTEAAAIILKDRDIPVVFLSSHTEPEIVEKTEKITSYGYVVKNSVTTVLNASIKMAFKLFNANKKTQEKEERYRFLVENLNDVIFTLDMESIITYVSPQIESLSQYLIEDVIGKNFTKFIHPDDLPLLFERYALFLNGLIEPWEFRVINKDSSVKFVRTSSNLIKKDGIVIGRSVLMSDITRQKQINDKLIESEEKYRAAFKTSPDAININAMNGRYIDINDGFSILTGYTRDDVIGKLSSEIKIWSIPEDREKLIKGLNNEGSVENLESIFRCKDGSLKTSLMSACIIRIKGEPHILSITRDITERKKATEELIESKKKYQQIVETAIEGIISLDRDARITFISQQMSAMLGYTIEEMIGQKFELFMAEDQLTDHIAQLKIQAQGKDSVYERCFRKKDGGKQWTIISVKSVIDSEGKPEGSFAMITDINERKLAEEDIQKLLSEKELVLKEVHHRIKNNMSTIYGLLILQAETMKDPRAVIALEDAGSRVLSMLVLYDKLYRSPDFQKISVMNYLPDLVDEIFENFPNSKSVKIQKKIDDFDLDAKRLQPLGIIINELLTNIMKYAFTGRDSGLITVSAGLKPAPTGSAPIVSIIIQDNGNGIPESIDFENSTGFGLQLVWILTKELMGTIRIEREHGTKIILEFELREGASRIIMKTHLQIN